MNLHFMANYSKIIVRQKQKLDALGISGFTSYFWWNKIIMHAQQFLQLGFMNMNFD